MGLFESNIQTLNKALLRQEWIRELAGIFPLSALIDFIDVPGKMHICELTGAVPLWNWPVTPAGSRILLSDHYRQNACYLDKYGSSMAFMALDGRYGDHYVVSCPETLRLCLSSQATRTIQNDHQNMSGVDLRIHNLRIVRVDRLDRHSDRPGGKGGKIQPVASWSRRILLSQGAAVSPWYTMVSTCGWVLLISMVIMSGILRCYLSLAFLVVAPFTGLCVSVLFGCNPRRLLVDGRSPYHRLVLVAEHMNSTDWTVFYGESTLVNSLLNRPLEPIGSRAASSTALWTQAALRVAILGQWGLAIGAAAVKDWNAFFITFWILFCIFTHAYLIAPRRRARDWMRYNAQIALTSFSTRLSSRRALLNTVIALNPDSFAWSPSSQREDRTKLDAGGMKWVDPILAPSASRSQWEEATRRALNEAAERFSNDELASPQWCDAGGEMLGAEWNTDYPTEKGNYWKPFVLEGIHMAARIRREACVPGRLVVPEGV